METNSDTVREAEKGDRLDPSFYFRGVAYETPQEAGLAEALELANTRRAALQGAPTPPTGETPPPTGPGLATVHHIATVFRRLFS